MARHLSKKKTAMAGTVVATTVVATVALAASPASAATSSQIANLPHSVQRACAERILAAQGPGAWTAWSGSLENMMAESGNNDHAINASSGAAGYYQIMPSTWNYLCSDLGASSVGSSAPAAAPRVQAVPQAPAPTAPQHTWSGGQHHRHHHGGQSNGSYTVQAGDTLSSIAAAHGTNWSALFQKNAGSISNPNLIFPGQVLSV